MCVYEQILKPTDQVELYRNSCTAPTNSHSSPTGWHVLLSSFIAWGRNKWPHSKWTTDSYSSSFLLGGPLDRKLLQNKVVFWSVPNYTAWWFPRKQKNLDRAAYPENAHCYMLLYVFPLVWSSLILNKWWVTPFLVCSSSETAHLQIHAMVSIRVLANFPFIHFLYNSCTWFLCKTSRSLKVR